MKRSIVLSFLISLLSSSVNAQVEDELVVLSNLKYSEAEEKPVKVADRYEHVHHNTNEVQLLFSGLFLFYKNFVSSQDAQSCSFTPSCSEYALEAVKKQGALKGMLNGFDRLSRCNSLSPEKYKIDRKTGLLIDPLILQ